MLRVLVLGVLMLTAASTVAVGEERDVETAESRTNDVQSQTRAAIEGVDGVDLTRTLPSFAEATERSATLPRSVFPNLNAELTDPKMLSTIAELMDNAQALAANLGLPPPSDEGLAVYVFASFSMPDASLKSLIEQAELAGVPIVLRGLVNNSIEDTLHAVHTLYIGSNKSENGAAIDPTLFERFGVDQVPSVVVAEIAAGPCTAEECPTPDHVKIAGDVPLRYALDRIATARPEFRHRLRVLLQKLEPERQW